MFLGELIFAFFMVFLFTLIFAVGQPGRPQPKVETITEVKEEEAADEKVFDVFFWVLLISLILIIVLGYIVPEKEIIVTA